MSDKHAFFRLEKIKNLGSLQRAHMHNFREVNVENADPKLLHLNHEIVEDVEAGADYYYLWNERVNAVKAKGKDVHQRKNSVLAYECVMSFSNGAEVDIEHWERDCLKWLRDTFGKENVLSAVVHMDEATPHIHAIVIPLDKDEKLNAKFFTGGRKKMFELQSGYGKAVEKYGLKRGLMHSVTNYGNIRRFYGEVNEATGFELPEVESSETASGYRSRINKLIQDIKLGELKLRSDLLRKIDVLKTELKVLKHKYKKAFKLYDKWEEKYGKDAANQMLDALIDDTDAEEKLYKETKENNKGNENKENEK